MCGFMEWLGWFDMSPVEQWGTAIKLIGSILAIGLGTFTVWSWWTSKVIELERELIEATAFTLAHLSDIEVAEKVRFSTPSPQTHKYIKEYTELSKKLVKEKLGLRSLRKLSKKYGHRMFYTEKSSALADTFGERNVDYLKEKNS